MRRCLAEGLVVGTPSLDELTDADLVQQCRSGSQAAWNALVGRFQRLVYTVPRRAGLSEAQSADVFQTVFSRFFEHLDRIDDPARTRAWLVTTAKRESLRLLEQSRRLVDLAPTGGDHSTGDDDSDAGTDPLHRIADDAPLPEQLLSDLQQQDRLHRALARLDARSRQLLELLFLQDETPGYAEIARRMNMAEGSIGPTRARCLAQLRALLRQV
ncbi:MAG: sigma-70 family RNA polymerase sigma factor [Pseudomonadota bacterium]